MKKIVLVSFLFLGLICADQRLIKIINNSADTVQLVYERKTILVPPGSSKRLFLKLPFSSRQKNIIEFVSDCPYVPEHALRITTPEGEFYMWCDERGVIGAKKFERGMSRQEAIAKVVLSLDSQDAARVVGCIITINVAGSMSVAGA